MNNVKTAPARGYHHGDLRATLIAAGLEIVEQVGPDAFSLRAAARCAGVSPAAPAHHFRDARGLLTAIATVGFVDLTEALKRADGPDRSSTLRGQCHAYLQFALARPGLFRLMWRKAMLDEDNAEYLAAARQAFATADAVVRPGAGPADAADPTLSPTIACWSLVHGFVGLVIDGAFFARMEGAPVALDGLLDASLSHLDVL